VSWRVTFFVRGADATSDGWLVRGDDGVGPPIAEDRFTSVYRRQDETEGRVDLRVMEVQGATLRLVGTSDRPLRPGDILGGEVER
jgi:hypothetical protein